jgi:branched-subunit amino acid aminotransferase/4-amino-4-deoxychorismate lyase
MDMDHGSDRLPLERCLPKSFSEVLMVSQSGNILEGMRSNFFVIRKMKLNTTQDHHSDAAAASFCLQTAPLQAGVLPGIIRAAVLHLAKDSCLVSSVIEEAPQMSDCDSWCEAFVTSGVKLIQPVHCIGSLVPNGNISQGGDIKLEVKVKVRKDFPKAPGDITKSIRQELVRIIQREPPNVLI